MKKWSFIKIFVPWLMLLVVTSCGTTTDYAGGGIGGTGISVGKITAFGSVWVNGIEFDTTGAKIIKDGASVLEVVTDDKYDPPQHLRLGMVVTVRGEFSPDGKTGKASSIEFNDNLEGPISAISVIDPNNQTFEVLGQTIKVNVDTIFDGTTGLSALAAGNVVEVSGLVDTNGIIHASYVSLKSETFEGYKTEYGSAIEVKGNIANLDPGAKRFTIGIQNVDYSNAVFKNITVDALAEGLYVEVKSSEGVVDGVLNASEIEIEEKGHHAEVDHEFHVEGYVTVESIQTNGMFEVEGQSVQITSNTMFENGASSADILVDVKIEVEGTVNANGILVADKIKIESDDEIADKGSGDVSGNNEPGSNGTDTHVGEDGT